MNHSDRHKRVRLLVKKCNLERKQQAKKIDILCNDLIEAQRHFIDKLETISFAAQFYDSVVGVTELGRLLSGATNIIKEEIPDSNIAFFLWQSDNFDLHILESDRPISLEKQQLENCFDKELVEEICRSNRICTLDDMFAMGLEGNLKMLNNLSVITLPLGQIGPSLGFILIYRSAENKLTTGDLRNITAITPGLSRAIQSCRLHSNSRD